MMAAVVANVWPSVGALAQTTDGDSKAMALRPNVVKITASFGQGMGPKTGFGFIVGQQQNRLVVVTADHVVRGDDPGSEDKAPLITFFLNQGSQVEGKLEGVGLPRGRGDLAVILVPNPGFARFVTEAIDLMPPVRGDRVWVVGRAEGWNIPASPGVVVDADPFTQRIRVENLGARVGSSGGPLVSGKGIVGMIVDDDGLYTEATPISSIQAQVRDNWRYVWQLTSQAGQLAVLPPAPPSPTSVAPVNDTRADAIGGIFSCRYEDGLKSLAGSHSTNLVFKNSSRSDISLFWLNYDGKRTFYYTLHQGAQFSLATYISHPWVVVDDHGQCLELVLPGKLTAIVNVQ
jgi:hypothetical protein